MIPLNPKIDFELLSSQNIASFDELRFEEEYSQYVEVKNISFCNNQTSALHLALRAIKTKRGDRIFCNIASDIRVVHTIRYFDAEPVFVDSDSEHFSISFDALRNSIDEHHDKKLKAIILDLVDSDQSIVKEYFELAQNNNLKLILYINAIAYKGLDSRFFDIGVLGGNDELTSIGVVVSDDDEIFKQIEILKNQAMMLKDDSYIDIVDTGYEYRASKFSLYYYNQSLNVLEKSKDDVAYAYYEAFSKLPSIVLPNSVSPQSQFYFVKIINKRDDTVAKLLNKGIEVGIGKIPLSMFSYFKNRYKLKIANFPNAVRNYQEVLVLPFSTKLTKKDVETITQELKDIVIS